MVYGKIGPLRYPGGLYLSFTRTGIPNGWLLSAQSVASPIGRKPGFSVLTPRTFQHVDSWSPGIGTANPHGLERMTA